MTNLMSRFGTTIAEAIDLGTYLQRIECIPEVQVIFVGTVKIGGLWSKVMVEKTAKNVEKNFKRYTKVFIAETKIDR